MCNLGSKYPYFNRAYEVSGGFGWTHLYSYNNLTFLFAQADLTVASNENRALVKEMEMLNHMFNAMERQYVSQASNSSASESYKNVSSFLLKSLKNYNFSP